MLELSHLAGSIIGLGLLVLARALFRRVQAAYHISLWLLVAGIVASLLKGLDFEEAILLALVLGVLMLGRRAFYRPTAILSERFTPAWVVSITGVIAMACGSASSPIAMSSYSERAVVDVRAGRKCAAHAARLTRGHRARRPPTAAEHAAAGASRAGRGRRHGSRRTPAR